MLMEQGSANAAPLGDTPLPPLSDLEGSFDRLTPDQAKLAYATSAEAARALIERAGPMVIYNLLTELGAGLPFDKAFERAAFIPYAEFMRTWRG
jgi:hypothetical protein